jgi:nicotinamidase-related amidase
MTSNSKLEVLTPSNSQIIFIDHQPQMAFGVESIDRQMLKNNVVALAKAAKVFGIPTTITTVETESFSGYAYPELLEVFPDLPLLERTSMNSWDDEKVRDALARNNSNNDRKKIVVSGLWTEVCNCTFALSAMHDTDYEIYMVADASGGTSLEAHERAMERMVQAGCVPVTWQQVMLEWQRDWARKETYDAVMAIVREHSGAYGMGVDYAYTMVHKAPQRTSKLLWLALTRICSARRAGGAPNFDAQSRIPWLRRIGYGRTDISARSHSSSWSLHHARSRQPDRKRGCDQGRKIHRGRQ